MTRVGKLEVERLFFFRLFGQSGADHFLQHLLLGLRLLGVLGRTVPKASNVLLHALDLLLFPLVLLPLILFLLGLGLDELIVVAVVVLQLAPTGEMDHVRAHVV